MTAYAISSTAPPVDAASRMRVAGRLSVAYLLDVIAIMRGDGDPIDTLLAGAIIQANVAEILQRDLAGDLPEGDAMPTDEMRRPVSISAVAASMGMPFETVRRRINRLLRAGYCVPADGGVIVPSAVLSDPKYLVEAFRGYERLRAFYWELRDSALLIDLPSPERELSANNFPVRTVSRLVGAYVLRIIESMGLHGDQVDGLILLTTFRHNIEGVPADRPGNIGDDERAPVSVSTLAAGLGLPAETVRRRVAALVERGACRRVRGGIIVPMRILTDPRLGPMIAGNAGNLQRLFASLSRLGVLKVWDALGRPA